MINFFGEDVKKPSLDYKKIKQWVKKIIENHHLKVGDISVIFCSDTFLLDYNIKYLNHNYFTDIITFNYNDSNKISGDLFISVDTVIRDSNDFNVTEQEEFLRVIIHGILHLLGFDDHTDEEISMMREQEKVALLLYSDF